jgi:hypothetical protein
MTIHGSAGTANIQAVYCVTDEYRAMKEFARRNPHVLIYDVFKFSEPLHLFLISAAKAQSLRYGCDDFFMNGVLTPSFHGPRRKFLIDSIFPAPDLGLFKEHTTQLPSVLLPLYIRGRSSAEVSSSLSRKRTLDPHSTIRRRRNRSLGHRATPSSKERHFIGQGSRKGVFGAWSGLGWGMRYPE